MSRRLKRRKITGFDEGYLDKVLSVEPSNLVGCWLQNEPSGGVSYDSSGNSHHGAYTGVTLGQPGVPGMDMTSPFFDGAGDFNNIYSAELGAAYNQAELSILTWFRTVNAGIWTDGATRKLFRFFVDANNTLKAERGAANNVIDIKVEHATTNEFLLWTTVGAPTTWQCLMVTISQANDRVFVYGNGVEEDAAVGLGVWAGPLSATDTLIGSINTGGGSHNWHGWIGPTAVWGTELSSGEAAYLSTT